MLSINNTYPNLIGKFDLITKSVQIEIFNDKNKKIKIPNCWCQQIGETGRWFWSTEYLPKNLKGKIFYRMISQNGQKFFGDFLIPLKEENNVG